MRKNHADGVTYEAGPTKGPAVETTAFGEGLEFDLARKLQAAGGHPGQADAGAAPFGSGSGAADWPDGQTWAAPSGAG